MKKMMVAITTLFAVAIVFTTIAIAADNPTIIIGGVESRDREHGEVLRENIPGSIVITPNRMWPLSTAAEELLRQIREDERVSGRIIIIGCSWAGLIARRVDAENPGLVAMIVTIGSPSGGFGPAFVRFFFDAGDKGSETPLYVIVGYNSTFPARIYMEEGEENDGTVTLKSALDFRGKKVSEFRVLKGLGHMELFKSPEVIQLVKSWVQKY